MPTRAVLLVALSGCGEFGVGAVGTVPPPELLVAVQEKFQQASLPAVDLLLVIDDTASMEQEQAALASSIGDLADALDQVDLAWQIGVTTTTLWPGEAGWLVGTPYVLTPSVPDVHALLEERAQPGVDGSAPEAGLAATLLALELAAPGFPNAGFLRSDATLHVVVLSDADDGSTDALGDDPVGVFLDAFTAYDRPAGPASVSVVVGDVPSGCVGATGNAQAGTHYAEVAAATGGVVSSICGADFGPIVDAVADVVVNWPTRFELAAAPIPSSVRVAIDTERQLDGWSLDGAAIVFDAAPPPGAVVIVDYLVTGSGE
jgi:hypothetical protein